MDTYAEQKNMRAKIRDLYKSLKAAPRVPFPAPRAPLEAPSERGVYIIFAPDGKTVLHIGQTPRAKSGLSQRLKNHLRKSSFMTLYGKKHNIRLREGYCFRCLVVEDARERALLEAYAIGRLCPEHIRHGE